MIIKGPISVTVKPMRFTIKNIDVAPSDYSVGINESQVEGYSITDVKFISGPRHIDKETKGQIIDVWEGNDKYVDILAEEIEKVLIKMEKAGYEAAWKRAKKRGYRGTKSSFMSEYT
jgi:hypothetical protein